MLLYQYLLHYAMLLHVMSQYLWLFSLILQGLSWRGRMPAAGILGWKRSKYWKPILHNSKSPKNPRKSFLELIRIIEQRKYQRGLTPLPGGWGHPPTRRVSLSPGPPGGWGSPGLGGVRMAGLSPLAGLLDYEDTRLKTSSRVRMGLSLAWKASLAIRICRSPTIVTDFV